MENWESLFVAQVGASAALTGLIFVSVSLNLSKILEFPGLAGRAAEALVALTSVLVISTLMLVPGQPLSILGIEILAVGITVWLIATVAQISRLRQLSREDLRQYLRPYLQIIGLGQISTLSLIIAGIVTLVAGSGGLYWLVPGILFSYGLALLDSWVLLIEINR